MFGDPVDNPMDWPMYQLSDVAKVDGTMTKEYEKYADYPHIGIDSIEKNTGILSGYRTVKEDNVISPKYYFGPQHILYSKIRPALNKVALPDFEGLCSADCYPLLVTGMCDRKFLAHVMRSDYFLDYVLSYSGRSQMPKVNRKQLEGFSFPCPPIELQEKFTVLIDQSDKSKFTGFKSQFIEMFGRPGYDDKGWGLTTLGECCELNPRRAQGIDDELEVSFLAMPSVSEDGHMDTKVIRPYSEVKKGFTYFAEKDVLFAKITPCMENGKGAVAEGLSNGIGAGSTEFHVLRPIPQKSNPYWLYIITMFDAFRINARKVMTGTGGQLRVPISYLKDYPITLPPIELQNEFEIFYRQSDKSK